MDPKSEASLPANEKEQYGMFRMEAKRFDAGHPDGFDSEWSEATRE